MVEAGFRFVVVVVVVVVVAIFVVVVEAGFGFVFWESNKGEGREMRKEKMVGPTK